MGINTVKYLRYMSPLHVALVQTNLHWEDKSANVDMLTNRIYQVPETTELVVLPEMCTTGFTMNTSLAEPMDGKTINWLKKISSQKRKIICGSFMLLNEENKPCNRLVWMQPNGVYGTYDKRHLFSLADEDKHYTAGTQRLIAQVKGWKLNMQICYDLRFPVWSRQQEEHEYDVLVYVANWPQRRELAWKTLLQARAIENQCYVIAVNRVGNDGNNIYHNGYSCVIDPLGEVLKVAEADETILTHSLSYELLQEVRSKFQFQKDKDPFILL